MTSISLKDAQRLGIFPSSGSASKGEASRPKRPSAKAGRIARDALFCALEVDIVVPFNARPKQRARTSLDKRKIMVAFSQARGNAQAFAALLDKISYSTITPAETKAFEETVQIFARAAMKGRAPHEGPIAIDLIFTLTGKPETWPTDVTDPDLDNIEKSVMDALNKIVWKDDRLVVQKTAVMVCGPQPSISMRIYNARSS